MRRAVVLFEETYEEVLVELVRCFEVDDINTEHACAVGRPVELHRVVVDVLIEVLVRLQRDSEAAAARRSLKRIHRIVIYLAALVDIATDMQPSKDLDVTENVNASSGPEPSADPRFVSPAMRDVQESPAR